MIFLEVIGKNVEDAIAINKTQASRIELCDKLEFGGYTPDYQTIKDVCEISQIPVNVIVRHTHKDFYSNPEEKAQILKDIEFIKTTKANGIVYGILNQDNTIDIEFLKQVIALKGHLQITFHKAFDCVEDFVTEYKKLNDLNVDCVLTSGGNDIEKGFEILERLKNLNLNTKILIGGGVKLSNFDKCKTISNYIHVGTAVRDNGTFEGQIDLDKIEELTKK
ncbi:copper homeostasis protein CutC [Spiroplasma culicicola]|uniref:Copper homeostasis protein cutC homolog n=1 Tax=Spiroplasma culicicola AES-1 TaxID=1276246 RepID=W6A7P1_9MOLU|nr:copper homeostasis protein CutC [Spiroplasma culicicola]AHI53158.1 copper homeostasis protein [Spiroplasma culicicola AES-1]